LRRRCSSPRGGAFPLTPLVYWLVAIHSLILILGAHYTYARVPLGFWMQDAFDLQRNHYDRIGHLMQGFGPAIVIRELLVRTSPLAPGKWLFTLVLFSVLGVSATYEFTEWWAALAGGEAAGAFLGTQGDVWDTQWDIVPRRLRRDRLAGAARAPARPAARRGGSGRPRQAGSAPVSLRRKVPVTYRWADASPWPWSGARCCWWAWLS